LGINERQRQASEKYFGRHTSEGMLSAEHVVFGERKAWRRMHLNVQYCHVEREKLFIHWFEINLGSIYIKMRELAL